jgi:CTP:molybdopterin cytidylyltransferase MocA
LVVVGHRRDEVAAEALCVGAEVVVNPDPDRGMFSSAVLGLEAAAGAEAIAVLPADCAFASGALVLGALGLYFGLEDKGPESAVIPVHGGRTGHPVILGRAAAARALEYKGQGGLRGALAEMAESGEDRARLLEGFAPDKQRSGNLAFLFTRDPNALCDIDTDEDLALALSATKPCFKPDLASAMALAKLAGPPRKLPHAAMVARLAVRLSSALKAACPQLAFMGAVLHDVDHGPSRHDLAAAKRLMEIGWPDLAAVVGAHTELPAAWARSAGYEGPVGVRHLEDAFVYEGWVPEVVEAAVIVHMADKYAKGDKLVSIDERFGAFMAYGGDPEVLAHVRRRWNAARAIERRFSERLGRPPLEAIMEPVSDRRLRPLEEMAGGLLQANPLAGFGEVIESFFGEVQDHSGA